MKSKNHTIIAAILFVLLGASCSSDEPNTKRIITSAVAESPAKKGEVLFEEKCVLCHGADGKAGISNAADLQTSRLDTVSIIRIITNGKKTMPAFSEQLGAGEIEQISNYVFTLRK